MEITQRKFEKLNLLLCTLSKKGNNESYAQQAEKVFSLVIKSCMTPLAADTAKRAKNWQFSKTLKMTILEAKFGNDALLTKYSANEANLLGLL